MRVCTIVWIWLATAAVGGAPATETAKWALVPAAAPAAQSTADLLTVELSQWDDVQLVERAAIDRVLAELKLNASGLVASDRAVDFGKLTAADVVIFVESLDKLQPPQTRVRAIETRTGVRLLDTLAPVKAIAADAQALASELKLAKAKWRTPADKRHYVAVLNVRSEESGNALQPLAAALSALVDHDLQSTPSVVVLEREQLRKLREEQQLTGVELELRSAVSLVELGLRRDESGKDLAVSLSLLSLSGQPPRTERFVVPSLAADAVRGEITQRLRRLLGEPPAKPPSGAADLAQEAKMFAERAKWLANYRPEEAVELAEAALALQPVHDYYRQAFQAHDAVFRQRLNKLSNDRVLQRNATAARAVQTDQLASLLAMARRMHDVDLTQLRTPHPPFWPMSLGVNYNPFHPHTPRIWPEAEPTELARLREEIDAIRWEKYRIVREALDSHRETKIMLLRQRLELSHYFAQTPEEFCRQTLAWQREFDEEFARESRKSVEKPPGVKRFNPQQLAGIRGDNVEALLIQRRLLGRSGSSADDEPRSWPADQLAPLWTELAHHEHLGVRAVGLAGLADLPADRGRQATQELVDCLGRIPMAEDLGFPPSALDSLAVQRLKAFQMLPAEAERRLAEAEQDPSVLWNKRPRFFELVFGAGTESYKRRGIALIDAFGATSDADRRAAADLRRLLANTITPGNVPLPADLRPAHPTSGPWAAYQRVPLRLKAPPGVYYFLGGAVDRDAVLKQRAGELLVFWMSAPGKSEVFVGRTSLTGGEVREVGRAPYREPVGRYIQPSTAITSGEAIFINTDAPGLAVLRPEGCRSYGEAEGFPGKHSGDMEWLDGALYVSLRSGLARFDPEQGTFRTLASNLSVDGKGQLDGGGAYGIGSLLADPARRQLWLGVGADARRSDQGIWKYTPATDRFESVSATPSNLYRSNLWWSGDKIRFIADFGWRELDPERGTTVEVAGYRRFERGNNRAQFAQYYAQSGDHILGLDGQLYSPDGHVSRYPSRHPWRSMESVPQGFLVHDSEDGLVLLQRRASP